jgi:hypothetical protein
MNNMWLYGFSTAAVFCGYVDLMRANQAGLRGASPYSPVINQSVEILGGIFQIVFFSWGCFVFSWWVPLAIPLICALPITIFQHKVINFPHLYIVLGVPFGIYSLL